MPALEEVLNQCAHGAEHRIPVPHGTCIYPIPLLIRLDDITLHDEDMVGGGAFGCWVQLPKELRELGLSAVLATEEEVS
jgi:hypothetical protein